MVEARNWNNRRGSWSSAFTTLLLASLFAVPLSFYSIELQDHVSYVKGVSDLGAILSPLSAKTENWAAFCWDDPKGPEVMRYIATGVQLPLAADIEPFAVPNYIPDELLPWLLETDMHEERHVARRFVAVRESDLIGRVAIGVVSKISEGVLKYRKIHDYSRPLGSSVNDACAKTSKKFATVRRAAALLRPGFYMAKIDLHKAFRYVGMALDAMKYLGCELCGEFLMDTRLPMGLTISPGVFHEITSIIARKMNSLGIITLAYLDDFLIIAATEEECAKGLNVLTDTVRFLGFDISPEKVELPTQNITFLGVDLDTRHGDVAMSLSPKKISSLIASCQEVQFSPDSQSLRVKTIESLMGKLNFACQVVLYSKIYLRAGYALVARAKQLGWLNIRPSAMLRQDLAWWTDCLASVKGRTLSLQRRVVVRDFFAVDACTSWGMGGFFDGRMFAVTWRAVRRWSLGFPTPTSDHQTSSINYLELFAVWYALTLWGSLLSGTSIVVYTDSSSVFWWLKNMWVLNADSAHVIALLKSIFSLCSKWDVFIIPRWLSTHVNVLADCLSRGSVSKLVYNGKKFARALEEWKRVGSLQYIEPRDSDDWMLHPEFFRKWDEKWGPFDLDGCCDVFGANSQLLHWSSDFLKEDVTGRRVFLNPPYQDDFIVQALTHLLYAKEAEPLGTAALIVLPFWWDKKFWKVIIALPKIFKVVERFEAGSDLFTSPDGRQGQRKKCGPTRWPVVVVRMHQHRPEVDWDLVWSTVNSISGDN